MEIVPGQRWASEAEPELGLGLVVEVDEGMVSIEFRAAGEVRRYALGNAPLRRVRFRAGDRVEGRGQPPFRVEQVEESGGLLTYRGEERSVLEAELTDTLAVGLPEERLWRGEVDDTEDFELRCRTWGIRHWRDSSPVRGFVGGRIALIPHQLYIAAESARRHFPRVLLSDEVGLGKTIEAGLILHRLVAMGRAMRILILVPESLVHQWFVELLRRFNLLFRIFDEARCAALDQEDINPFLDDQLVLAPLDLLTANPVRLGQALAAGWDLLIVDEAHHLEWSPAEAGPGYRAVESLARQTPGLLLLTATPEQSGRLSHFARLRLLDPDRFFDYAEFVRESEAFERVSHAADKLVKRANLDSEDEDALVEVLGGGLRVRSQFEAIRAGDEEARAALLDDLIDRHGTGRVVFRNTRATISGFPKRTLHEVPLVLGPDDAELSERLRAEFELDLEKPAESPWLDLEDDPRIEWLAGFIREHPGEKILLICRSLEKVEAIAEALRRKIQVNFAVFHESLPLVHRDRNAAWFAEEDGAQILLCSEIGSEGRNFQFAHLLVLFDLPLDPEVLEQRIGRLDRIGQREEIHIYVPFVKGTAQELLFRWYDDGLRAFEKNVHGAREVFEEFGKRVEALARGWTLADRMESVEALIDETRVFCVELEERLHRGKDHLLELHSFRPGPASKIVEEIRRIDQDPRLEEWLVEMFDRLGIEMEPLAPRTFRIGAGDLVHEAFPALPSEGLTVTTDRTTALAREDMGFVTFDHPLVTAGIDSFLGSARGNSAWAVWEKPPPGGPALLLEAHFVLETVAPRRLGADRFLAAEPIRTLVDDQLRDWSGRLTPEKLRGKLRDGPRQVLTALAEEDGDKLAAMLAECRGLAEREASRLRWKATQTLEAELGGELRRLQALRLVNPNVPPEEIAAAEAEITELRAHIASASLRLDCLRLIWSAPG